MKNQRTDQLRIARRLSAVLLFGVILILMVPAGAWAVGTASGTAIQNQATITYDVGTITQNPITSDSDPGTPGDQPTQFLVDNMVDLSVSTVNLAGPLSVAPGSTQQVIAFQANGELKGFSLSELSMTGTQNRTGRNNHATHHEQKCSHHFIHHF